MANVTYLLGAGASCKCLPTYANFSSRLIQFRNSLQATITDLDPDQKSAIRQILSLCDMLIAEFSFHNTPDTIAKKYFHLREGGKKQLEHLKIILVLYFMFEQSISDTFISNTPVLKTDNKSQLDKRYDTFIAAILEPIYGEIKLRSNFSILTWNYDLQFELAFKNYDNQSIIDTKTAVQCIPSYRSLESEYKFERNKFSIINFNGIAYNKLKEDGDSPFEHFYNSRLDIVKELLKHFTEMNTSEVLLTGKGLLNFAWERDKSFPYPKNALDQILSSALEVADRTEVLVIIGYSFPIFNRDLDAALFSGMKNLRKVYIQSPIANELKKTVLDAFAPLNEMDIVPVTNLDYFHIPHEANRTLPNLIAVA
jgi:hypothetical protein